MNRWLHDRWESLDSPLFGRRVPGTLVVTWIALVVGLAACIYTTRNGSNLWYSDAQSHLTIARRIFDSKAPGFQQLGTVWLPVPHLLLVPLVIWLPMWSTGWGACVLGMLCLAASVAALYRIAARFGMRRMARLFVVIFFLANPSILYTYTTALTEPVLIATMLGAIAGISGWMTSERKLSGGELAVFAGIPAGMSVLSRYEGWALVASGSVFVAWVSWKKWHDFSYTIRMTLSFVVIPAACAFWWFAYNFAIYGKPFEFMFGEYSAAEQQRQISESGLLSTKLNLGMTTWVYGWSVIEAAGIVLLVLAFFGVCTLIVTRGFDIEALLIWLTATPIGFSLLSLYLGQTAINNDHSLPPGWWNNRFALSAIPFLALLAGVLINYVRLSDKARRLPVVRYAVVFFVTSAIALQNIWWFQDLAGRSGVIAEAVQSNKSTRESVAAGKFMAENYQGGNILMDETRGGNSILPEIGIPLNQYYNRATGELLDEALDRPTDHAEWLFVNTEMPQSETAPTDLVFQAMRLHPDRFENYRLVYQTPTHSVYRLVRQ
ncbi:MAG: hypothetical protein WAS05_06555 [Candidatus Nanopelagicales bacterium]